MRRLDLKREFCLRYIGSILQGVKIIGLFTIDMANVVLRLVLKLWNHRVWDIIHPLGYASLAETVKWLFRR